MKLKRFTGLLVALSIVLSLIIPMHASAASKYSIYINNQSFKSDYEPIVYKDAVYVPIWAVLGQLKMSADFYDGVLRINHPWRVLLIKPNQDLMTYYARDMVPLSARLQFEPIVRNNVIYVPLIFLSDYLDMKIAYSENGRIDITSGNVTAGNNWSSVYDYTIQSAMSKVRLDGDAERFWSQYSSLWFATNSYIGGVFTKKFEKVNIVGYSGSTVQLAGETKSYNIKFSSQQEINDTFYTYDPLESYDYSEYDKNLIRQGSVRIGMTKTQALLSWGNPSTVNKDISRYSYSEQWVYRHYTYSTSYLYFDGNGVVTYIQS